MSEIVLVECIWKDEAHYEWGMD